MIAARARRLVPTLGFAALALAAGPALAHPGHPGHEPLGLLAGFVHPFTGADHLMAMTSAGLLAARRGGRALAAWPATFLLAMAIGFNLGGLDPSWLEPGVLASVLALGVMAATTAVPDLLAVAILAAAGALHGMAHAADVGAARPSFELGMLAASALLQGAGAAAALSLYRAGRSNLVRLIGAGVAACGFVMAVGG